ncbi:MAG: hypothetical protein WAV11_02850 [Minisyncoccia bacterium]
MKKLEKCINLRQKKKLDEGILEIFCFEEVTICGLLDIELILVIIYGKFGRKIIERFQKAIKDDYCKNMSFDDANMILSDLVDYFDKLAEVNYKILLENNHNNKNYEN